MEGLSTTIKHKRRIPFVAALLSFVYPGIGQAYNGQFWKALIFLALPVLGPFLQGYLRTLSTFEGFIAVLVVEVSLRIIMSLDAFIVARRLKEFVPPKKYQLYLWCIIGFAAGWIIFIDTQKVMGYKSFSVPTPSLYPTLQLGDRVIADMRAYRSAEVARGDIILFDTREGPNWVFRVAGLPLDTIAFFNNVVVINGDRSQTRLIRDTFILDQIPVASFQEIFPDGHNHEIVKFMAGNFRNPLAEMPETVIPADNYFVVGDNRDNAMDSRQIGTVHSKDIKGKIMYTYWGKYHNRIGIDLTK